MTAIKHVTLFAEVALALAVPLVLPFAAWAGTGIVTPIYTVPGHADGMGPTGPLVRVGSRLFGTTFDGGTAQCGTVFSVDPKNGLETIVYSFTCMGDGGNPDAGLTVMAGKLYGTTVSSGSSDSGTVFKVDPASGAETTVAAFPATNKATTSPLLAFHGALYGTSTSGGVDGRGSIFTADPSTGTVTTIYSFAGRDGASPVGGLVQSGSKLYGTTYGGGKNNAGTIYRVDPKTGAVTMLYSFQGGSDGQSPEAPLIELGGMLYGTTAFGGGGPDDGVVFSFDPAGRAERVLYSFTGGVDGSQPVNSLTSANGLLYGLASGQFGAGTLFSIDPASGAETTLHAFTGEEGYAPRGGLVLYGSVLYGTQSSGGLGLWGTVFSFDPATALANTLHSFTGTQFDGVSAMIKVGGSMYGTTAYGGAFGLGSIFKVDRATGAGKIVYSFNGKADGVHPIGDLIEAGGILYGTTYSGGSGDAGTVFGYDPGVHKLTTLHGFSAGADGAAPYAGVVALNGELYGTTEYGGTANAGTVYRIDLASGAETVLYTFKMRNDGNDPRAGLTIANGLLYGMARFGGADECGTIYSIDPSTGNEALLYAFQGSDDGCQPITNLLSANGVLYGSTSGHRGVKATAFVFDPGTLTETVLHSFKAEDGPAAPFIAVQNRLYAPTRTGGDAGLGSLISLDPATGHVATLYSFAGGSDGKYPMASLLQLDGLFYGTADIAGNAGVVFGFTK